MNGFFAVAELNNAKRAVEIDPNAFAVFVVLMSLGLFCYLTCRLGVLCWKLMHQSRHGYEWNAADADVVIWFAVIYIMWKVRF